MPGPEVGKSYDRLPSEQILYFYLPQTQGKRLIIAVTYTVEKGGPE